MRTDRTSVKFSPGVIERQGGIGAAVTCTSDVLIGILFCFPVNVGLTLATLAMPTDIREFIAVWESVLPMRASWSGAGPFPRWFSLSLGWNNCLIVINENINAQTYINDVLSVEALPFIQFLGPNVTVMHDNARPHSAALTRQFLATNNVSVLYWPANSPDLNPIQQVWDELGSCVRRNHAIHTVNDLAAALQAEWANLPAPFIQRYGNSMHSAVCRVHYTKWWTHEILTYFIESPVSFC